mgnify:CR=1 FL=1
MKLKHILLGFNHTLWGVLDLGFNLFFIANALAYTYGDGILVSEQVLVTISIYALFSERTRNALQGYSVWVPSWDKENQDDMVIWYMHRFMYWLQWVLVAALFCSVEGLIDQQSRWLMLVVAFAAMRVPLGYVVKATFSLQAMHSRIVSSNK